MGKSPGKWIKTLLFGKKATRSHSKRGKIDKKAGNNKGYPVDKEDPTPDNSPVISEPILVSTYNNGVDPEVERGNPSSLGGETTSFVPTASQGTEDQGIPGSVAPTVPEKSREEQAATKAQAVLRGFLARRAFRALKGIIRLQALVRGHLVRRQAIVTLHSMVGIIKLQAHFRGQKVRSSGLGLEVNKKFDYRITVVSQYSDSRKGKLYTNTFVCKLLSSSLVVIPLQIYYDQEEPNSVPNWMERWSISCFWKLPPQPKKTTASKSQAKRGSYAMETESGRPKRNVRKNSPVTVDVGPTKTTSEPDKPKRNVKKFLSSMDSVQDPQSELEKVKRNLRKVSGSLPETSDGPEITTDAQPCSIRKVVDPLSENPEQGAHESEGKTKKDIALTTEVKPDMEIEGTADQLVDNSLPNADKDGNVSVMNGELNVKEEQTCTEMNGELNVKEEQTCTEMNGELNVKEEQTCTEMNGELNVKEEQTCTEMNGELNVKEEQTCTENQKTSKRRASFSAKSDYAENGLQNTPTLPSYMQATKSAKAKLRGLNSARFGSDSAEKNEPTRRHSLPSSVNGKVNSYSPRTQKILQTSGKGGGCRSDRSLLSSRDGNEKLIHVGWRR